jgi:hypothetical protein
VVPSPFGEVAPVRRMDEREVSVAHLPPAQGMASVLLEGERSEGRQGFDPARHAARSRPNWPQPCLARPQWEGMMGARRGCVGAAAGGGARWRWAAGGASEESFGGKREGGRWWRRGVVVRGCIAPGADGGGARGGVGGQQRAMAMGRILEIHANLDADT